MTERWLPITGYEGLYFISSLGRVRSIAKIIERINWSHLP